MVTGVTFMTGRRFESLKVFCKSCWAISPYLWLIAVFGIQRSFERTSAYVHMSRNSRTTRILVLMVTGVTFMTGLRFESLGVFCESCWAITPYLWHIAVFDIQRPFKRTSVNVHMSRNSRTALILVLMVTGVTFMTG